ncbi:hypothetical protein Efla_005537 [Eimeria flavescens]
MQNSLSREGPADLVDFSAEAFEITKQHASLADSPVPPEAFLPQQQREAESALHSKQQETPVPADTSSDMATCARRATLAAVAAAGPVAQRSPRLSEASLLGSFAAERSLGQQLHQLSFELNDQLHVDNKRTRTAHACCSLCKASQAGEGPCTTASCKQTSTRLGGPPEARLTQAEPPQSSGSAATADAGNSTNTEAAAMQQKGEEDCCLTCSCPCHNGNTGSNSSIVCFEGPRRPPTFAANLADLCRAFPSVHQGLIVSLLETAENDLQRAHALVRVVSDTNTGLHNPKTGGPLSKRKRCPDTDADCLAALRGPSTSCRDLSGEAVSGFSSSTRSSRGMDVGEGVAARCSYLSVQQQQQPLLQQQTAHAAAAAAAGPGAAAAAAEPGAAKTHAAAFRLGMPLGGEQLPEAWCNDVAERLLWAIVTAASGDDAKAKAAALLREHALQLAHAHQEGLSQAELAKEAERQELAKRVELLQNDKLLLARATLQNNLAAKTEEALHLMQELSGAQQRLRSLREAASALLLGSTPGRSSPCRDNSFDRRFPDVF